MKTKINLDTRVLDALPNRVRRNADRIIHHVTPMVAAAMREGAPVDAGELKGGIHEEYSDDEGHAVSEAPHSIHVEYGTSHNRAQPFIRPAVDQVRQAFESQAKGVFK